MNSKLLLFIAIGLFSSCEESANSKLHKQKTRAEIQNLELQIIIHQLKIDSINQVRYEQFKIEEKK